MLGSYKLFTRQNHMRVFSFIMALIMLVFSQQTLLMSVAMAAGEVGELVPMDNQGYFNLYNEPYHSIKLKKTDATTGVYLPGAEFELSGFTVDGDEVGLSEVTDSFGTAIFNNLKAGTYTLKEVTPPEHYALDETEHVILVDEVGTVQCDTLYFMQNSDFADYLEFPDERLLEGTVEIIKHWVGDSAAERTAPIVHLDVEMPFQPPTKATVDRSIWSAKLTNPNFGAPRPLISATSFSQNTSYDKVTDLPADAVKIDDASTPYSIYFWMEGRNAYWWSDAEVVRLPANSRGLFSSCSELSTVDLSGFDASRVTDMYSMFSGCNNLTDLDLGMFNTSSVTNMGKMFENCNSLTSLDLGFFDTSRVSSMSSMFKGCNSLTNLNINTFDMPSIRYVDHMFDGCSSLTSIDTSIFELATMIGSLEGTFNGCTLIDSLDLSYFSKCRIGNIVDAFGGCESLTSLDLSAMGFMQYIRASRAFLHCSNLTSINFGDMESRNNGAGVDVLEAISMFSGCNNLQSLDLSGMWIGGNGWYGSLSNDLGKYTNMFGACTSLSELTIYSGSRGEKAKITREMFSTCSNLTSIDLSHFDMSGVTDMSYMFDYCEVLPNIDLSPLDTSNATNMSHLFWHCDSLTSLDLSPLDTSNVTDMSGMFAHCINLASLDLNIDTSNVKNMSNMFYECYSLTGIDLSHLDTSSVTSMAAMFRSCSNLTSVDMSSLDTSSVTSMDSMFEYCSNLISVDMSSLDTSSVTTMKYMFSYCSSLNNINWNAFDTSSVTSMDWMFSKCISLTNLDLSSFDTSKVGTFSEMFYGCENLTSVNLSSFNTANATLMDYMFYGCSRLSRLDLSSFNTSKLGKTTCMFSGCSSLTTIYASELWDVSNLQAVYSTYMFDGCNLLTGGNGTAYNSSIIDKTYAYIDTASTPGYLTYKAAPNARIINKNYVWYQAFSDAFLSILISSAEADEIVPETTENGNEPGIISQVTSQVICNTSGKTKAELDEIYDEWIDYGNNTWKYRIHVFDKETYYYIWESQLPGYSSDSYFEDFLPVQYLEGETLIVNITNTKESGGQSSAYGSLDISKELFAISSSSNSNKEFTASISLSGDLTGVFGDVYLTNGSATLKLKNGEHRYITGLPVGTTWSILETGDVSNYDVAYVNQTGTVQSGTQEVKIQNIEVPETIIPPQDPEGMSGTVTITKVWGNDAPEDRRFPVVHLDLEVPRPPTTATIDKAKWSSSVNGGSNGSADLPLRSASRLLKDETYNAVNELPGNAIRIDDGTTDESIYFWKTGNDCYWWSDADIVYLPSSASDMFYNCANLSYIDDSNWDTSKVTGMSAMFYGCSMLSNLDVSNWNTSNVTNMELMFSKCSSLSSLAVDNWDTSSVHYMNHMFANCSSLLSLNLSRWNVSNVYQTDSMFSDCSALTSLNVDNWTVINIETMQGMFRGCSSLTYLNLYDWDWYGPDYYWWDYFSPAKVKNMKNMFRDCTSLQHIDGVDRFVTQHVTNMSYMFYGCSSLDNVYCDGEMFDLSSVTDMSYMFYNCSSADYISINNYDAPRLRNMKYMFYGCSSLYDVNVSIPGGVTDTSHMFEGCANISYLSTLYSDSTDTSGVTDMSYMFAGMTNCYSMDLAYLDTNNVSDMTGMFQDCSGLETVYVSSKWSTGNVTASTDMFKNCWNLYGEKGTGFDSNFTDKTYARIDNRPSVPGYFSAGSEQIGASVFDQLINIFVSNARAEEAEPVAQVTNSFFFPTAGHTQEEIDEVYDRWIDNGDGTWTYRFHVPNVDQEYYVWESYLAGYDSDSYIKTYKTMNYSVDSNENVTITNTKKTTSEPDPTDYGNLIIQKVLTAFNYPNASFPVTITAHTASGSPLDGLYGEAYFKNGTATVTLKNGQSVSVRNLPVGATYSLSENVSSADYGVTYINGSGTITAGLTTATIRNVEKYKTPETPKGNLTVSKQIQGMNNSYYAQHEDEYGAFTFTVRLSDDSISGKYGDMVFNSGKATVKIKHGESATATGLPVGITYTVTENNASVRPNSIFEQVTPASEMTGTIRNGVTSIVNVVNSETVLQPGEVFIRKEVSGESTLQTYPFVLSIYGATANSCINLYQTGSQEAWQSVNTDSSGNVSVQLELPVSTDIWFELPQGAKYRITERETDYIASFEKSVRARGNDTFTSVDKVTNTVNATSISTPLESMTGDAYRYVFTNTAPTYPVQVLKLSTGGAFVEEANLQILRAGDNSVVDDWNTVETHISYLAPGSYILHEVVSGEGFQIAEDIAFTLEWDGTYHLTGSTESLSAITMEDEPIVVSVIKVDKSNPMTRLSDAKLQLMDSDGTVLANWTSTSSEYDIGDVLLPGQTYTIHEYEAPAGYYAPPADFAFTVSADGSAITIPANVQQYVSVSATADGYLLTLKNEPGLLMPATGGYENYLYIGGGALIVLAGVYYLIILARRKKEEKNENENKEPAAKE